jgi:hypothetical protein
MARKTVLRRHSKVLPMSGDLLDTFERDDAEEERARGAAQLLEVAEEKPLTLPTAEQLDEQIDPETGEVLGAEPQRDSRGMTEVDEETARELDNASDGTLDEDNPAAEEGPAQEQRGEQQAEKTPPKADFDGTTKPEGAKRGQTWYNPAEDKLRYAHETPNGIKWYMQPQKDEPSQSAPDNAAKPSLAERIKADIRAATDLSALSEAQEAFGEAKPELSDAEKTEIRELIATRRNELS